MKISTPSWTNCVSSSNQYVKIPNSLIQTSVNRTIEHYVRQDPYWQNKPSNELTNAYLDAYHRLLTTVQDVTIVYKTGLQQYSRSIPGHFYNPEDYNIDPQQAHLQMYETNIEYGPRPVSGLTLLVIGKCPSVDEATYRKNFCGPVGRDALSMLRNEGILHLFEHVYLTNLCKWVMRIPGDAVLRDSCKECIPILYNELAIVRPQVIIYFGSLGLISVMRKVIQFERKKIEVGDLVPFTFLLPNDETYDGLFMCLPFNLNTTVRGYVKRLRHFLVTGELSDEDTAPYKVVTNLNDLVSLIDEIEAKGITHIALDTEWYGRYGDNNSWLRCIQLGLPEPVNGSSEHVIVLRNEDGTPMIGCLEEVGKQLSRVVLKPGKTIVGSFIFTDAVWLKTIGLDLKTKFIETIETNGQSGIFDIAMAAKATDEYLELDLCKLASVFLGVMAWDREITDWVSQQNEPTFGHAPAAILFPYAAKDVKYSLLLERAIRQQLEHDRFGNNCYQPYLNNMRMCAVLCEMMSYGLKIDIEQLSHLRKKFTNARERLLADVRQDLNWPEFDPGKTQHLVAALFNEGYLQKPIAPAGFKSLNLTPIKSTNKRYRTWDEIPTHERVFSTPSVDKEVCGILAERHPVAAKIRDLGIFKHVLNNIFGKRGLETYICDDGRVRSFIAPTTESGRCSSSRPNVQNFSNKRDADYSRLCGEPIKMRSFLTAEPGYDFIECDFVAAELMLLAVMSNDLTLLEHCLRSALPDTDPDYFDIHSNIAVSTFGFDCEPTKKGLEAIGKSHFRVVSKSVIYGLNYGRGAPAIREALKSEGIHIELYEVEAIMDRIFQTYSRVPPLLTQLRKVVYDPGFQINHFGRCRRFIQSHDRRVMADQERESMNFPFQSMTADCLDILAYLLYTHPEKERMNYRILVPVHDALWMECPKEHTNDFMDLIYEVASTITFRQWDTRGMVIGDREYSLGISVQVKGE